MAKKKEKKKNCGLTELVFILDMSGSMHPLVEDTIGGFNSMIDDNKNSEGDALVTTILFDDEHWRVHDRIPVQSVPELTTAEYMPRGITALLDAVGDTIQDIKKRQQDIQDPKVERTLCIIMTDGHENASKEYTSDQIKGMIEDSREKDNWEFIFVGANMDSIEVASQYGIASGQAVNYHSDSLGTAAAYSSVSSAVGMSMGMSCETSVSAFFGENASWRNDVDQDYQSRNNSYAGIGQRNDHSQPGF